MEHTHHLHQIQTLLLLLLLLLLLQPSHTSGGGVSREISLSNITFW
jgi:hypothetical protein